MALQDFYDPGVENPNSVTQDVKPARILKRKRREQKSLQEMMEEQKKRQQADEKSQDLNPASHPKVDKPNHLSNPPKSESEGPDCCLPVSIEQTLAADPIWSQGDRNERL